MDPEPVPPQVPQLPKSPLFPLLILLLVTTLLLAYQNMQLKKQIVALQIFPIPPISQITPTTTVDPTENWQTYQDVKSGYSFAYPNGLTIRMNENGVINFLDSQDDTKFNFAGFQILSPTEYQQYQDQRGVLDQINYTDAQDRTWSTDMVLGEVFNFTGILNQNDTYTVVSLQSGFGEESDNGNSFRTLANQILSTFKFLPED